MKEIKIEINPSIEVGTIVDDNGDDEICVSPKIYSGEVKKKSNTLDFEDILKVFGVTTEEWLQEEEKAEDMEKNTPFMENVYSRIDTFYESVIVFVNNERFGRFYTKKEV